MNQKIETLLQVSLAATSEEREKEEELRTGYEKEIDSWEIIFSYAGDIKYLEEKYPRAHFRKLLNRYVVAVLPGTAIEQLAKEKMVEWIEKPKRMFFELENGKREACIPQVQRPLYGSGGLFGEGTLIAIIDSGINAVDAEFRNPDGSSRIRLIYDQKEEREMTQQEINLALAEKRFEDIPGEDLSGHGTKVAAIACGNHGTAPRAEIIVVKLGISKNSSYPRTTQLMEAVSYVLEKSATLEKPVAVNISFGNNYGNHAGSSLLERYMNDSTLYWKSVFCVGSGNEGVGATHAGGVLQSNQERVIELGIMPYETAISIQIWKEYWDDYEIELITPTGINLGRVNTYRTLGRTFVEGTKVLMLYGESSPYSVHQEIYLELLGWHDFITPGIWKIRLTSGKVRSGRYDIWLPAQAALNLGTGFLQPDSSLSCTIPGTAERVITVGAYDAISDAPAPFSGRGIRAFSAGKGIIKPDLTAPGVNISLNESDRCTGTSFSTPFVTGAAALLMEWGIVRGNDPFLYGEKLRAYLIKGARPLPGFSEYPNPQIGWGALCVKDSLPV